MIEISISGPIETGPSWSDLERLAESMTRKRGCFTRIARRDGHCNYRGKSGVYDVTFLPETGDDIDIVLRINS